MSVDIVIKALTSQDEGVCINRGCTREDYVGGLCLVCIRGAKPSRLSIVLGLANFVDGECRRDRCDANAKTRGLCTKHYGGAYRAEVLSLVALPAKSPGDMPGVVVDDARVKVLEDELKQAAVLLGEKDEIIQKQTDEIKALRKRYEPSVLESIRAPDGHDHQIARSHAASLLALCADFTFNKHAVYVLAVRIHERLS